MGGTQAASNVVATMSSWATLKYTGSRAPKVLFPNSAVLCVDGVLSPTLVIILTVYN